MVKVTNYKALSPALEKLASPNINAAGRHSIGLDKQIGEYYYLSVSELIPFKNQARKMFNDHEIEELAATIKDHGILQPLRVFKSKDNPGFYEVISGERRLRAAKLIPLEKVPCMVLQDELSTNEVALIENLQRSDLHPIELGLALLNILEDEPSIRQKELSKKIGIKESVISEAIKLAELPNEIREHMLQMNIRGRELYRKLLATKDLDLMKHMIGINSKRDLKKLSSTSIMRIFLTEGECTIQKRGLRKLNHEQKEQLKMQLLEILKQL
jgi:ParB family chromosome partitioning protein